MVIGVPKRMQCYFSIRESNLGTIINPTTFATTNIKKNKSPVNEKVDAVTIAPIQASLLYVVIVFTIKIHLLYILHNWFIYFEGRPIGRPLILIVTNLESFGVVGTIILAFLAVFVVLGKGTGGFLPFFLLIFVPFGMAIALGVFVTLWWLGWIGVAFGIGIVHYRDLKKYKQELIEVLQ